MTDSKISHICIRYKRSTLLLMFVVFSAATAFGYYGGYDTSWENKPIIAWCALFSLATLYLGYASIWPPVILSFNDEEILLGGKSLLKKEGVKGYRFIHRPSEGRAGGRLEPTLNFIVWRRALPKLPAGWSKDAIDDEIHVYTSLKYFDINKGRLVQHLTRCKWEQIERLG